MANRHPTGWISNSERALTQVAFRLPQQTVDQLKDAAARAGVSQRTALKEAIHDFAEKQRSASPRRQRSKTPQRNVFDGDVAEHRPEAGLTLLRWRGRMLEARYQPAFAAGAPAAWLVPASGIVLHRRDRPSRGDHENPLPGTIAEVVILGDTAQVTLLVDGAEDAPLEFSVLAHVAARNRVEPGEPAMVSLRADAIHLMPCSF